MQLIASKHARNFIYYFILHVTTSNVPAQCVKTTENRKCYGLFVVFSTTRYRCNEKKEESVSQATQSWGNSNIAEKCFEF